MNYETTTTKNYINKNYLFKSLDYRLFDSIPKNINTQNRNNTRAQNTRQSDRVANKSEKYKRDGGNAFRTNVYSTLKLIFFLNFCLFNS